MNASSQNPWRGVWPIVTTPFRDDGSLDVASLGRVVEHIVAGSAHGLVYPAIASEFQMLRPREREQAVEHVLGVTAGRRPVIVGVSTASDDTTPADLTRHAAAAGASGVMFMARPTHDVARVTAEFAAIAEASDLPIVLQNAPAPIGPSLPVEAVCAIAGSVPAIRYVKEETQPCGQRITRLLEALPGRLDGVFGGAGGRFVLDELARGAVGSMPACEFTALHVRLYALASSGQSEAARALFNAMLPLLNFESVFRTAATKFILHRMGIIGSPRYRDANPQLDAADRRELLYILDDLAAVAPVAQPNTREVAGNG